MSRFVRYAAGTGLLAGLLLLTFWMVPPFERGSDPSVPGSRTERKPWQRYPPQTARAGTDEDPYARRRYDWMRLHDPETGRIPPNIREKELAFAKQIPAKRKSVSAWNRRGPENIGGRTRALAYDVSDPSGKTILAAGVSGGIWRTTNGGDTWTRTFDPGQRPNVTTIVQDTSGGKTDIWYAGTGEWIGNSASAIGGGFYHGNGLYKSTDGGRSWRQLPSTTSNPTQFESFFDFVYRVRIDPSNDSQGEVYAATYDKIFRSIDGGENWTAVLEGDVSDQGNFASQTDVAVTSDGVVYATLSSDGDQCGIFRSSDGVTWTEITPSGWPGGRACENDFFRTVLAVNPSNEDEVWFLSYARGYGPRGEERNAPINHVLWRYNAATDRWTNFSDYLPARGGFLGNFSSQGGYDLLVDVHPKNPDMIYAGGVNLWAIDVSGDAEGAASWIGGYSVDGGSPFYQPPGSDPQHPDQHTLAFHPTTPNVMLTGSDGGVHRTGNNQTHQDGGVTYTSLNNGYFTTQFYHVCMNSDPRDPTIMGGMQDNGTWFTQSSDPSVDWTRQQGADGGECEITTVQNGSTTLRYASIQGGSIFQYRYSDGELVWRQRAFPQGATGRFFIHPFEIDPSDPTTMYYPAGDSLYRNTSLSQEPAAASAWTGFPGAAPNGYIISALRASTTNNPHVLYYGAADIDGDGTREDPRFYRVDDATGTFAPAEITTSSFPEGAFPSDIAVDPASSDKVLVAFSNYGVTSLFYSSDAGQTWTDVEGNLGGPRGPSVRSVSILPQPGKDQTTYYAATSVGLYSTTSLSENTTWHQESPNGIGNVVVNDVESRTADGQVLAGTHANGVYSSDLPVPVRIENYRFSKEERGRGVTITWETPGAVSPSLDMHHEYRGEPFASKAKIKKSSARTYRFRTDSLPPGPHTFRLRQIEGPNTARTLRTSAVTIPPEGKFELTNPAPNPFRRSTSMRLTVRKTQSVQVSVYNTLGQRVAVLLDRELSASRPVDLRLTADDLASGVYFVSAQGETFEGTRKIVLVR